MGSVEVYCPQIHNENHPESDQLELVGHSQSPTQMNRPELRSFDLSDLATSHETWTLSGMEDEILLLSWLIVLLRTREDTQFWFEWTHKDIEDGTELRDSVSYRLPVGDIVTELHATVRQTVGRISAHINGNALSSQTGTSSATSLVLSTGALSQTSDEIQDEPLLHIQAHFRNGQIEIEPVWHEDRVLQFTITRHMETLADVIKTCLSNPDLTIADCLRPISYDLDQLWSWNRHVPPTYDYCMHDAISERAQTHPDKLAIDSWDGSLTYGQVDTLSTTLAHSLRDSGVQLNDFVGLCFEKSRWTIVAVLAVMKAGATIAMMDPSLPLARLQNMATQVGTKSMLTSLMQHGISKSILPDGKIIPVGEGTFPDSFTDSDTLPELPTVPSSTLMYIIFTSGSTGTPKGVQISHQTYTSSAIPRAEAVGYTENSRVLDFASYAFDVSIDSMLLTLGNGGCLCIPSDEDRLNDINSVMRDMRVNYAGITPSVARILDLEVIASLSQGLGLGGEAVSPRDCNFWGQYARIIIGYGPCECTIGCTVNSSAATGRDYITIGPGNGAAMWIVDPNDHEILMPVGAVGELLVEGPIVGQGYLNDPEKTEGVFIRDPKWLTAGHSDAPGRQGRLYKTGDLGRYDPAGTGEIVFVGRKDTQVKLRGQRVELGEIESQLKARLPRETNVIVEVVKTSGSAQPTLVAFVAPHSGNEDGEIRSAQLPGELQKTLSKAATEIGEVLPRYMVPNAYIPVNFIPTLISGKTDRKRLRAFGVTIDLRDLADNQEPSTEDGNDAAQDSDRELDEMEQRLRDGWIQVLKLDSETAIHPNSNFFALGGDSLAAMKLVSLCRTLGLDLSVTDTFGKPTLAAMAKVLRVMDSQPQQIEKRQPFAMISPPYETACIEAARLCGVDVSVIQDIYPCTPTQESLFTFSLKSAEPYVAQRVAQIPSHITIEAWKKAWESVIASSPILRTRVVQLDLAGDTNHGLRQIVLQEHIPWKSATNLEVYLESDRNSRMDLGQSLARYGIIQDTTTNTRYMVWTLHHVVYDGWSEPLVLDKVRDALLSPTSLPPPQPPHDMGTFVQYVRSTDQTAMTKFWRTELQDAVGPQFPTVPSRDFIPTPDTIIERRITFPPTNSSESPSNSNFPFTLATLIRGAWALVSSQFSRTNDVVFGETLTGRDIPLPGVETIIGPLIATVPVRIKIDRSKTVEAYLRDIQDGILARTAYQHMGMQNIRKASRDAQIACEASTGLVIQPQPEMGTGSGSGMDAIDELGFERGDVVREAIHFNPYSLMIACGILGGSRGFRVAASFDRGVVGVGQMERVLAQLEVACLKLMGVGVGGGLGVRIGEIGGFLGGEELERIWGWNCRAPLGVSEKGRVRADGGVKVGEVYPPVVVPWVCDPLNSGVLSPIGCPGELWLEGDLATGEVVESPAWLVAGSKGVAGRKGRVHATGDIVTLQEDGSLVFVGRKDDVVAVQGGSVDVASIEGHLVKHLGTETRVAAVIPTLLENESERRGLVVFIEYSKNSEEECIEIVSTASGSMISTSIEVLCFKTTIQSMISIPIAAGLKKFDRFAQGSLASHSIPSAYIILDQLPASKSGQVDRSVLGDLASQISQETLDTLCSGMKAVLDSPRLEQEQDVTAAERILRSAWTKILGIDRPEQIDVDDNFFRLGGDSVLAMKLVSYLGSQGHKLTVANIFRFMKLGDAAKVLKVKEVSAEQLSRPYKPFSMLPTSLGNVESFISEVVRPQLEDASWAIKDVYPVTDSQAMDIKGTIHKPRTSMQYIPLYFNNTIDQERLFYALKKLVKTHDILRTVFIQHESLFLQVVLAELEVNIATVVKPDDTHLEQFVKDLCAKDSDSDFELGSSFLRLSFVESKNKQEQCLVIGLSHAQYDGMSIPMILQHLEALYTKSDGINSQDVVPFSSYMWSVREETTQKEAVKYWAGLLEASSLSTLDRPANQPEVNSKALFKSNPVEISSQPAEITTSTMLTAAWALVLARRLKTKDVTFGGVTSGRGGNLDMENVSGVMGPCYQLTPVRVSFQQDLSAMDLLQAVQKQTAESGVYDFLGFDKISKECTGWTAEGAEFFNSIVHHQDVVEGDFEAMAFAGGSCKVDLLSPHGDAAYPLKVVSFFEKGRLHVGVVGSEAEKEVVEGLLGELTAAMGELGGLSFRLDF